MTILVQFTLSHPEDKTAEIVEFFNEILPDTRTFNGNLSAELYQKDLAENALFYVKNGKVPLTLMNTLLGAKILVILTV